MLNFTDIEHKWQQRWGEAKLFEANPKQGKKKFFCTFPYPYVNAFPHIGHLYTIMRVEALARYKRSQGYNVLFPQGWHATGTPIVSAAKRVKAREEKQIKIMADMGIEGNELKKFEKPEHWITYFVPEAEKDYKLMGLSIDWRRQFYTTNLNPYYDKFVQWQFRKLKEQNYLIKGKFPVVWDPLENCAIGDHDRSQGEGEVPQEFLLVKHKLSDGKFIVSATLRPDTILGITNLYVNPKTIYADAKIEATGEHWVISETAVQKLQQQNWKINIIGKISGTDLVGQETEEFSGQKVLVLPATFLDEHFGTGLVHSVPSDSADDLIALEELQKNEALIKKYHLDPEKVKAIQPIPCLETPIIGSFPAAHFLRKYNITSQQQRAKLEEIKKELYKLSYYEATFGKQYTQKYFSKNYVGMKVQEAKDEVKEEIIRKGWAVVYYQLTGKVVSRYLNECIVKIVDNQWFMNYSNEHWKQKAHQCLEGMQLYPEKARQQFNYVIDWLHNWACTREEGLGTKLPWDNNWLIESLSDSTVYMAYYTIVHLITKEKITEVNDDLFDYVLLGKGKAKHKSWDRMRAEFTYWYPLDFRNSGKDLIQNHLTFFIFHHTAIFPEQYWPKGIGVNGWVTVDGQKMSKSLGNMIPLREMPKRFCADAARFTILSGGESLDDPNWDSNLATACKQKLEVWHEFCKEQYNTGSMEMREIDHWLESKLHETIHGISDAMEQTLFRTASQNIFFAINQAIKWYLKRTNNRPNKRVINEVIEAQIIMLSVFCPHIAEETWEAIGKKDFVSTASWPKIIEKKINLELDCREQFIEQIMEDCNTVLKIAHVTQPKEITLIVTLPWKCTLFKDVQGLMFETKNPQEILKKILNKQEYKQYAGEIVSFLPRVIAGNRIPKKIYSDNEEACILEKEKVFFEQMYSCKIHIVLAKQSSEKKAQQAMPGKVAIMIK